MDIKKYFKRKLCKREINLFIFKMKTETHLSKKQNYMNCVAYSILVEITRGMFEGRQTHIYLLKKIGNWKLKTAIELLCMLNGDVIK